MAESSFLLMLIMGLMIFKECFHVMFIQGNQKHNYCAEGHSQDLKHRWKIRSLRLRCFRTNKNFSNERERLCFLLPFDFSFWWICLYLEFSRKIHFKAFTFLLNINLSNLFIFGTFPENSVEFSLQFTYWICLFLKISRKINYRIFQFFRSSN